ncbi:MAG: DUF2157 domain-containing protein [Sphingobacteriales bacterium]|nr:MAG: DUF2157 domain-containing protein [Sphingobacteriales bacterium]
MSKHILNELPELLKAGIISADTSDSIENYYRQKERAQPDGRINVVFAIIGTLLVSLGIILIVAHNWDELSRPVKLFFAFVPVLLGQVLCGFTLYKKQDNITWKECSASFLFFAAGACLALVSQMYHINESLPDIIFNWMLITFPLIYIMRSSIVSLLFICGTTIYAMYSGYDYSSSETYHYWWMILLVLPHYFYLLKDKPQSNFTFFHHWFIPLSLTICLGTLAHSSDELMFIAYMSMFGAFYLIGTSDFFYGKRIFGNGYIVLGSLGTMCLLLALSSRWLWMDLIRYDKLQDWSLLSPEAMACIITTIAAVVLLFNHLKNRGSKPVNLMGFIFLAFVVIFFIGKTNPLLATTATNLLVLAAAIFTIDRGNRLNHLGILNYGLLIIMALVVCRFFDTNISFVIRGLMFIGVGAGFFIANSRLIKKRKQHEKN